MKQVVSQRLDIQKEALAERYLGLPTKAGRKLSDCFEYLPSQVKGRDVLIKSIAQAVPTYSMSCFLLPLNICNKMRSVVANYWWGSSADNRHMHWMSWERLNQPKHKGGMGFWDMRSFNLAMLGKQGWRLITRPNSLCARVLKGRYYHDTKFLRTTRKKHASSTWRAILAGRDVQQRGLIRRVVDGDSTTIWGDRWIADHFDARPITPSVAGHPNLVSELLTTSGSWNVEAQLYCDSRWVEEMLCPRRDRALIMIGMWALWMLRNRRRHGELTMPVQQAVLWAKDIAYDLWQLSYQFDKPAPAHNRDKWRKPEVGWSKINTDDLRSQESKQGATLSIIER
ncbi:unnamed protein product [Miscanthus lutarioriparius]|uniref:Uncharacterized protein n=1 Tax=Miscanthus lutarioriparius TaxID=422564 RepID=A0A811S645_9POAL|nr:unnamed protein product [Miscanthus lutarioriparius]